MNLDLDTLYDGLISHQRAAGFFETVTEHEPKAAPGDGVSAATWFQRLTPMARVSGLNVVSCRIEVVTRLYTNMLAQDEDRIDPRVYRAATLLMELYAGDFTLGGRVMHVDLLGAYGEPLSMRAGYLRQDNRLFRVVDIITPVIAADVWTEAP